MHCYYLQPRKTKSLTIASAELSTGESCLPAYCQLTQSPAAYLLSSVYDHVAKVWHVFINQLVTNALTRLATKLQSIPPALPSSTSPVR